MSKNISPSNLQSAIEKELTLYKESVTDFVNAAGENAIKQLVTLTKSTAPKGLRGSFRKNISSKETQDAVSKMKKFTWYVKAPDHRLTHLIVHGHATVNGGRTKSNPFLENALDTVFPQYEQDIEEAVRNG